MYSLEKWTYKSQCRVIGAAGKLQDAKAKADLDADKELVWVEDANKRLIALDGHVRYEIRQLA